MCPVHEAADETPGRARSGAWFRGARRGCTDESNRSASCAGHDVSAQCDDLTGLRVALQTQPRKAVRATVNRCCGGIGEGARGAENAEPVWMPDRSSEMFEDFFFRLAQIAVPAELVAVKEPADVGLHHHRHNDVTRGPNELDPA